MTSRVTQDEFDMIVEENMTEFDMNEDEARQDAIKQLNKRDLAGVAVTNEQQIWRRQIGEACAAIEAFDASMPNILEMLAKSDPFIVDSLVLNGALGIAFKVAITKQSKEAFTIATTLTEKSAYARDVVPPEGLLGVSELLQRLVKDSKGNDEVMDMCLCLLITSMKMNELNKRRLNEYNLGYILCTILHHSQQSFILAVKCICAFLQRDDDRPRSLDQDDFGRGRRLGEETECVKLLIANLSKDGIVINALRLVCVSDRVCLLAIQEKAVEKVMEHVEDNPSQSFSLLRTLCLNDDAKARIGLNEEYSKKLLTTIEIALDQGDDTTLSASLGCLEMVVLRQPRCVEALEKLGCIPLLITCIRTSKDLQSLKYSLRALRNMISHPDNGELKGVVRNQAEEICRSAGKNTGLREFAEACLRDMGADNYRIK